MNTEGVYPVSVVAQVTMAYGPSFTVHIPRWLQRAVHLGVPGVVLFCLDAESHDACRVTAAAAPPGVVRRESAFLPGMSGFPSVLKGKSGFL